LLSEAKPLPTISLRPVADLALMGSDTPFEAVGDWEGVELVARAAASS
jgi:hypothetical protein